jgi:hypothetical protein
MPATTNGIAPAADAATNTQPAPAPGQPGGYMSLAEHTSGLASVMAQSGPAPAAQGAPTSTPAAPAAGQAPAPSAPAPVAQQGQASNPAPWETAMTQIGQRVDQLAGMFQQFMQQMRPGPAPAAQGAPTSTPAAPAAGQAPAPSAPASAQQDMFTRAASAMLGEGADPAHVSAQAKILEARGSWAPLLNSNKPETARQAKSEIEKLDAMSAAIEREHRQGRGLDQVRKEVEELKKGPEREQSANFRTERISTALSDQLTLPVDQQFAPAVVAAINAGTLSKDAVIKHLDTRYGHIQDKTEWMNAVAAELDSWNTMLAARQAPAAPAAGQAPAPNAPAPAARQGQAPSVNNPAATAPAGTEGGTVQTVPSNVYLPLAEHSAMLARSLRG